MTSQPDARTFVAGLVGEMQALFARLGEQGALEAESQGRVEIVTLLQLALKSELEAAELAGYWLPSAPEIDVKMAFARQCGDEMKHYHLISRRLEELGSAPFDPMADGYSPLYQYLKGLKSSVERVAAGPFAREAIAEIRNEQFIALCERQGDVETARVYRETIQPEEVHHHRLGRELLEKYCTTPEAQALAAAAARAALAIADELSSLTERATGLHGIPTS